MYVGRLNPIISNHLLVNIVDFTPGPPSRGNGTAAMFSIYLSFFG
jgi:hypothetical protein